MSRSRLLKRALVGFMLVTMLLVQAALAQPNTSNCDVDHLLTHQDQQAQALANFQIEAKSDLNAALTKLYRAGFAYQQLALECGLTNGDSIAATYVAEQTREAIRDRENMTSNFIAGAIARTIGDPAQGKIVFDTFRSEVGFACVTCHRVDSTEMLVGPGLLDIGNFVPPSPSDMTATPAVTAVPKQSLGETIAFLRISILNPDAYLMPGYPMGIMPRTYGTILSEADINNLVAYLMTLH